jgi:IS30 family transposase
MTKYKHLNLEEREILFSLREQGKTFRQIGEILDREHTTLSREYRRNILLRGKDVRKYLPCKAQAKADKRSLKQRQRSALKSPRVFLYVRRKLRKQWSPESIAGRLKIANLGETVHFDTIYRYIYNRKKTQKEKLWQYLKLHRKRRMRKHGQKVKQTRFEAGLSINDRPSEVNERQIAGHWETDNMEGLRSDRTVVSATVERVSRYIILNKLDNKKASGKTKAVVDELKKISPRIVLSLTTDRGSENSEYKQISEQLDIPVYFTNPYHSWEKGTVENSIGRLRRFIPKKTSIDPVDKRLIKTIQSGLNNTPRKCLGFLTPREVLRQLLTTNSGALPIRM